MTTTTPQTGDTGDRRIFDPGLPGLEQYALLGYGRSGVVLRAVRRRPDHHVAVKLLLPASDDAVGRVETGLRRVAALPVHSGIVRLDEIGLTRGGLPFAVMEYMEGGSLASHLARRGPLAWPRACEIIARVADALESAHRRGVLHGNLKPENILLSGIGMPKVVDFWVDAAYEQTPGTAAAAAASTQHAAPEVLAGESPSSAADTYSLASILFTLLAGHAPFRRDPDEPAQAMAARAFTEPVPDLRSRGISATVCGTLEAALALVPTARPRAPGEFSRELRRAARATPGTVAGAAVAKAGVAATIPAPAEGRVADAAVEAAAGLETAAGGGAVRAAAGARPAEEVGAPSTPAADRGSAGATAGPRGPAPNGRPRRAGGREDGRQGALRLRQLERPKSTARAAILLRRAKRGDPALWTGILVILGSLALVSLAVMAWRGGGPFASAADSSAVTTSWLGATVPTTTTPPTAPTTTTTTTAPSTTTLATTTTAPSTTTLATTTTTTAPPATTTTRPPATTTTAVPVTVLVSPGSAPRGAWFTVSAAGLTPNGRAIMTVGLPGGGAYNPSPEFADAAGRAQWSIGSGAQDPVGRYSVTVVDETTGRRGFGAFDIA